MKMQSTFVGFLACPEGHHRDFTRWHDEDHRPENVGQIEHVYHAERWVAPPEFVEARRYDADGLLPEPVHYVHTYWSTANPDVLLHDMTVVRERLEVLGRNDPINRDFRALWRDRMYPLIVLSGTYLSVDALAVAPHEGLVASLIEVSSAGPDYARRLTHEALPALVALPSVQGVMTFMPRLPSDNHLQVQLCLVRGDTALAVQQEIDAIERDTGCDTARIHHRGAYRSSAIDAPTPYR